MRQRLEGESPSQAGSEPNHLVCLNSSNMQTSQRKSTTSGESNEGYSRGDDGENPLQGKIEKADVIDSPQKQRKIQKYSKEMEMENFQDLEDMEIDTSKQILGQEAIWLAERKALAEELARKGPISIKDDSVTLHHASYQKYTRKLLLQRINIKGKQVIEKRGSKIDIKNANPSDVMELHRETGETLSHTMDDQERENAIL